MSVVSSASSARPDHHTSAKTTVLNNIDLTQAHVLPFLLPREIQKSREVARIWQSHPNASFTWLNILEKVFRFYRKKPENEMSYENQVKHLYKKRALHRELLQQKPLLVRAGERVAPSHNLRIMILDTEDDLPPIPYTPLPAFD